ncbi:hypothetical protein SKAU_G00141510 [Synaphobranchus kaupii]|uniref:Uncharacterized protein n=1 Tax=Synaphobranchus kaupii TaxID=118154 RepID=A0A9Q1FSB4_SYNKA|nr:hypothetical protein SKAU_G00141510 [Synaphobranchus kaupii]
MRCKGSYRSPQRKLATNIKDKDGFSLARVADDLFHYVVGAGRLCSPIFRSKRTKSWGCHHDVDINSGVLLLILADSYSGPG